MDPSSELLNQLEGLELPVAAGLGIAPGWWLLLLVLLLLLVGFYYLRRRQSPESGAVDWRPSAQRELVRIRRSLPATSHNIVLADCSRVARRIALAAVPREEVASLHGEAWMQKLDELGQTRAFSSGAGQLLLSGPYQLTADSVNGEMDSKRLQDLITELDGLLHSVSGDRA